MLDKANLRKMAAFAPRGALEAIEAERAEQEALAEAHVKDMRQQIIAKHERAVEAFRRELQTRTRLTVRQKSQELARFRDEAYPYAELNRLRPPRPEHPASKRRWTS